MTTNLTQLREAVLGRGRQVEVSPRGEVREVGAEEKPPNPETPTEKPKPTRLAPRTFGVG
jgi:hypothetical protein